METLLCDFRRGKNYTVPKDDRIMGRSYEDCPEENKLNLYGTKTLTQNNYTKGFDGVLGPREKTYSSYLQTLHQQPHYYLSVPH